MFGASAFGACAFGQIRAAPAFTPLAAASAITVSGNPLLRQESFLIANVGLAVASVATLALAGSIAASSGVTVNITAPLLAPAPLRAAATIRIGTERALFDGGIVDGSALFDTWGRLTAALTVTGPLRTDTTIALGTAAPLRVGGHPLAAAATLAIGSTATLRSLPATFATTARVAVGTVANLVTVGFGFADLVIGFDGAVANDRVRRGSVTITDVLNEAPNSCTFIVDATPPPAIGTDIKIGLGNLAASNLLFAGTVRRVDQRYELRGRNPSWTIDCLDYTFLINRRKVFGTWTNVSATDIANYLIFTYTSGFGGAFEAGLPPVTVTFDGVDVMEAFTTLANLVGGYTKVDYAKRLHLFLTDPDPPPHPLDGTAPRPLNLPEITKSDDETQVRTRVYVKGQAVATVGPSETLLPLFATEIPLEDATRFAPSGQAITDDGQRLTYTGTAPGALAGTVVGNVGGPSASGTPAIAAGVAGRLSGWYSYKVAFASSAGETTAGPPSAQVFAPDFVTPGAPLGIGVTGAVGPLVGVYQYRVAFLTTLGETLPGPIASRTAQALTAPTVGSALGPGGISALGAGTYQYRHTDLTPYGETSGGAPLTITQQPLVPQINLATLTTAAGAGPLSAGTTYTYALSFVTALGETLASGIGSYTPPAVAAPVPSVQPVQFGGIYGGAYSVALSLLTAVGETLLYGAAAGTNHFTGPPSQPVATGGFDTSGRITPGPTYYYACTAYHDTYGETPLSASSSMSTFGAVPLALYVNLPGRPPRATGIRLYRVASTANTWKLVAEFPGLSTGVTLFIDRLNDGELGAQWPKQPAAGVSFDYTLPASGEAGVIGRRLYRTKAGGSEYFLVGEMHNNIGGYVFEEGLFDAALVQRDPAMATTGRLCALSNLSAGPLGVIGRRLYRQKGSTYFLIGEIKDNVTTTWLDGVPDASLTLSAPGVNTAGSGGNAIAGSTPRLQVVAGPPGTVGRRLYRTKVNGAEFFLLAEFADNTTTIYDDYKADAQLDSQRPPVASTGGGDTHVLSSIPTGPAGTLARLIYRTKANGSEYQLLTRISDNVTTTFVDNVPDGSLGKGVALVNEAGSSAVLLSSLPIGPASISSRLIFRTVAGGSDYRYVGTVSDNVTTTFLDDRADGTLGRPPLATSTIGALVGETTLALNTVAGFPPVGWVQAGNAFLHYTGISGTTLLGIEPARAVASITRAGAVATLTTTAPHGFATGDRVSVLGANESAYNGVRTITVTGATTLTYAVAGTPATPATGTINVAPPGAILAPIPGGTVITTVPMLTGVAGLIYMALPVGSQIALWVPCDSAAGQAALQATEGGDGIHEYIVADSTLDSIAACTKRGQAELRLFQYVQTTMTYATRDPLTRSGAMIHVDLPAPQNYHGDFRIQEVRIDEIGIAHRTLPRYSVTASTTKYTLQDLLRHVFIDV